MSSLLMQRASQAVHEEISRCFDVGDYRCEEVVKAVLDAIRDRPDLSYSANVNWQNRIDDILEGGSDDART